MHTLSRQRGDKNESSNDSARVQTQNNARPQMKHTKIITWWHWVISSFWFWSGWRLRRRFTSFGFVLRFLSLLWWFFPWWWFWFRIWFWSWRGTRITWFSFLFLWRFLGFLCFFLLFSLLFLLLRSRWPRCRSRLGFTFLRRWWWWIGAGWFGSCSLLLYSLRPERMLHL